MNSFLQTDESLDDLQLNNLHIIQKQDGFKFGTDAVLLSDFAKDAKGDNFLDLCTGSGIIPILLSAKSRAKKITGLEIQETMSKMANRSVIINNLSDKVEIVTGDLKECSTLFTPHSFDAVTINPPYMKADAHLKNSTDSKTIARHEVLCTLSDCVKACADMLKFHGSVFMIHRPKRLLDITEEMRRYGIEPKTLRFVHPSYGKEPTMLLIHGVYKGGRELKILPPLYIYDDLGNYTEETLKIYGREG